MNTILSKLHKIESAKLSTSVLLMSTAGVGISLFMPSLPDAARWTLLALAVVGIVALFLKGIADSKAVTVQPAEPSNFSAGWYPTPAEDAERYYDGAVWTEDVRPRA